MGKAYDDALARWNASEKKWAAQKIYIEWWRVAKRDMGAESDGDALLLDKALDIAEDRICYPTIMDSTDYDETMRAIEIMEELNGNQEEGHSDFIAGMVEAS